MEIIYSKCSEFNEYCNDFVIRLKLYKKLYNVRDLYF